MLKTIPIKLLCFLLILMSMLEAEPSFGQYEEVDTNSDVTAPDPGSTPAPFDGGIAILIAAGVGVGLKKANHERQKALGK